MIEKWSLIYDPKLSFKYSTLSFDKGLSLSVIMVRCPKAVAFPRRKFIELYKRLLLSSLVILLSVSDESQNIQNSSLDMVLQDSCYGQN